MHKNQFIQLQNLRHEIELVEIGQILKNFKNQLKNKNCEFQKMMEIVNSSQTEFRTIQNITAYDKICKSFLKQSNISMPMDSYQYDCSNNSYIVKGKSFNKNSSEYKKKVMFQSKLIKKKNKEINRLNEKIMGFHDSILGMQIEIKMYRKMENKNQSYMRNIKSMIILQEDKIKYYEKEILEAKKKISKLKIEVQQIIEDVKIGYLKNVQKLKCFNYIVRKYIRSTIENNSDLKRFISEIKTMYKNISSEKTTELIHKYRDLQLINNTLKKKYIPTKKDVICEKKVVKKKKKKKRINKKISLPEIKTDVSNLQNDVKCKMEELRNVLKEKSKSMKEIVIIIEEIKDIKNLMEKELISRQDLKIEIKNKKKEIVVLETKIDKITTKMVENEKKLEMMKSDNDYQKEDIGKLEKIITKQKLNIKGLKKSKKDIKTIIKDKENTITKKDRKINKLVVKLEKVNKKNIELKKNFENQFKKIQEICEESFEKYILLEDLMKKEKIFNQLYKLQCNKIIIRDKKIYDLKNKFEEQEKLLETLMTKKLTTKGGDKNDQEKISFLNLPTQIKKNFKINKSLSKKIKSIEKINNKLKLVIESWEKKYNKLLQRFEKLRSKYNDAYDNEIKENLDTIDTLKKTVFQYEKVFEEMKKKKDNDETEKFELFLDNLHINNELSEIDDYNSSIEKKYEGVLNLSSKIFKKEKGKKIDMIKFEKLQKFFFSSFICYEEKLKGLENKIKIIKEIFVKQILVNKVLKKNYDIDLKKIKEEDIMNIILNMIKTKHEISEKEKENILELKKDYKKNTKNLKQIIISFETFEIFDEIDSSEIKIEKIKKYIKISQNLNEDIKKKKMVILELRSQVNEAWEEIKEKEKNISELEEQNFNMMQINEENENEKNLEKKRMKKDLNDLKELVKELKTKNGHNKLEKDLLIKIENQEKGIIELKNDIQKKVLQIASLQKTITKNRLNSNRSLVQKNKINSKNYYSFNDNSDLSYSEMSSIQIQLKKQNGLGLNLQEPDFESDNSSLFLKNQNNKNETKNDFYKNGNKKFGEKLKELEEEIELSENNSSKFEKNKKCLEEEEFDDFFVGNNDDNFKEVKNDKINNGENIFGDDDINISDEGENIFDVSGDKEKISKNPNIISFKI